MIWKYWQPVFEGEGGSGGPPASTPPAVTPPVSTPPVETPPPKDEQPWYLKRIDALTREKYELQAKVTAAESTPPPAAPTPPATPPGAKTYTQAEIDQLTTTKAAQLAEAKTFNDQCNVAYNQGISDHPDFQQKLNIVTSLAGGVLPVGLVQAALETESASEVLYALGKNPELAQEILTLPPAKMAVRVAKLAAESTKEETPRQKTSSAPEPIVPKVKGVTATEPKLDDPNLDTKSWMELRNKQLQQKRA